MSQRDLHPVHLGNLAASSATNRPLKPKHKLVSNLGEPTVVKILRRCAIALSGVLLCGASPTDSPSKFDLICIGKITLGDRNGQLEKFRLSVDLNRNLFAYQFHPGHPIASASEEKIVFEDHQTATDENHFWVMRGNGHFVRGARSEVLNVVEFVSGSCEAARFTDIAANKF